MRVVINDVVYIPKENKLEIEYPIFKRNKDGEVFRFDAIEGDGGYGQWILHKNPAVLGVSVGTTPNSPVFETIPYDKERGLYHLQPVWCWDDGHKSRATMFYDVELKMAIGFSIEKGNEYHWDNMEPITPEQLKVMPWLFDMYQQVLKDNKIF